jgi:hypothetical protein
MTGRPTIHCPGPLSRRKFLRLGAMALGGLGLGNLSALRAQAKQAGKSVPDTSVIFIWLPGGPPHLDMYDMKPDAPAEYRGEFRPVKTNVPGLDVCEHMPRHAKIADKFAIIRSIAHTFADHGGGHKRFLTGRDPLAPTGFVNDYPMVGSLVARVRQDVRVGVPNYVAGVDGGRQQVDTFSFGSAYLGPSTHPFTVFGDPSQKGFQVQNLAMGPQVQAQVKDRLQLLGAFDGLSTALDASGTMTAMDAFRERGLDLLTTDVAQKAFDLTREPETLRERYGMHVWGQRALLARRLVEAGASFVTMVMENPYQNGVDMPKDGTYNWDSHAVNCHLFNDTRRRLPYYDRAVTALIEDLYARGLDRKVMLIVTGEFGRTPRIEYSTGTQTGVKQPGRDHWPSSMSVLVSGGDMRMGQVIGSTNARGEHPKDHPLTPNDLWATMFRHLGIDFNNTFFLDHGGRPMPILPYGDPITELL